MWEQIIDPDQFHDLVAVSDSSLDTVDCLECVRDGMIRKEAEAFEYVDGDVLIYLYAYRNFTLNYWVFNYTTAETENVGTIGGIIVDKCREFLTEKVCPDCRLRVTTGASSAILDWIKANTLEHLPDQENTRLNEQVFRKVPE